MSESEKIPKTAREALIIELLGDLGAIHDQIKQLPNEIGDAINGSINSIANAVEDAEQTTLELTNRIDAYKKSAIGSIDNAIKESFDKYAVETFSDLDKKVSQLQYKINSFDLADPKGRRLSFILSGAIIVVCLFSAAALAGFYLGGKEKVQELTTIINMQSKQEEKGLAALPADARQKYKAAIQDSTSN